MNNVLQLTNMEAREHFLKEESYVNFDLPRYFSFGNIVKEVSERIEGRSLAEFYSTCSDEGRRKGKPTLPCDYESVNYRLLHSKDGKCAWRPLQIIHPVLYVSLVHSITEEAAWNLIVERFQEFDACKNIECCSIPVVSTSKLSDKAATVSKWWSAVEQKSIEKALEYDYILQTDISDCYSSIYTHSIPWSLHTKEVAKAQRKDKDLIGNIIDRHLQDMSYGQTNGIPQGSVLMDFIAEMVLGFADVELQKRIETAVKEFKVIRYRDDYRVFTNSSQDAELIVKNITEVLVDLGLCLNPRKTVASSNVIEDSIKSDKLFWTFNRRENRGLQAHLLLIHNLAKVHPNSGSLIKALTKFFSRIKPLPLKKSNKFQNVQVLISIIIDIAYKNPRTYPISIAILSKLFTLISDDETKKTVKIIITKFRKLPNTGHWEIWLQRAILNHDNGHSFEELLRQFKSEVHQCLIY